MAERYPAKNLPQSEIVEAGYLEAMLQHFAASYKLFWLKGIYTEIMKGNRQLEYKRVVARMIAAAWYPVVYFNLNLGHADLLADTIHYVHNVLGVKREEQEETIVTFICESKDRELLKQIKSFTSMVPFRLIRPFYQRELEYEKKVDHTFNDGKVNFLIEKYNKRDHNNALYSMNREEQVLTISPKWAEYIIQNATIIEGWMNYKLIEYIQQRNPNVPAIPFKIFPPVQRNLSDATKYWEVVQRQLHLPDIFTGEAFTSENIQKNGTISIDHFIPWSFVLHDELWNLYPMFKNVNSSKGNKLPDLNRYLESFCENQYKAFVAAKSMDAPKQIKQKWLEQYLTVSKEIFKIDESDKSREFFVASMRQTIEPLYQIASNQGYGVWWWE
ncbi:MAG TPA: HNH endonuclease domain-containing protein [Lachnospiraceae bacterium]|nr:HNH endonuclease domain-containing protein [Lachnospiraceae bacterium]